MYLDASKLHLYLYVCMYVQYTLTDRMLKFSQISIIHIYENPN